MGQWLEPRGLKEIHAAVTPDGRAVALVKEKGKTTSNRVCGATVNVVRSYNLYA